MTKVLFDTITTEHETTLEVAARLAACCTFYYAEQRSRADFRGVVDVVLVHMPDGDSWRLAEPGSGVGAAERAYLFRIDGRSNEGASAREILRMIAPNTNPMPTTIGRYVTENMGRYMVLEIDGRRLRVRSEASGWELWIDWDYSGYRDPRNAWRCI